MELTPEAQRQVSDLRRHYEDLERLEALRHLNDALVRAAKRIERNPAAGLPAPRPYPQLARDGEAWIKAGSYWIAYSTRHFVILGVFYDQADIPNRLSAISGKGGDRYPSPKED